MAETSDGGSIAGEYSFDAGLFYHRSHWRRPGSFSAGRAEKYRLDGNDWGEWDGWEVDAVAGDLARGLRRGGLPGAGCGWAGSRAKTKSKSGSGAGGQECPPHTGSKARGRLARSHTGSHTGSEFTIHS